MSAVARRSSCCPSAGARTAPRSHRPSSSAHRGKRALCSLADADCCSRLAPDSPQSLGCWRARRVRPRWLMLLRPMNLRVNLRQPPRRALWRGAASRWGRFSFVAVWYRYLPSCAFHRVFVCVNYCSPVLGRDNWNLEFQSASEIVKSREVKGKSETNMLRQFTTKSAHRFTMAEQKFH